MPHPVADENLFLKTFLGPLYPEPFVTCEFPRLLTAKVSPYFGLGS
jgi:hypothetical protein